MEKLDRMEVKLNSRYCVWFLNEVSYILELLVGTAYRHTQEAISAETRITMASEGWIDEENKDV